MESNPTVTAPKARRGGGAGKRISPRVDRLITLIVDSETPTRIALAAASGLSEGGVYKALSKPHIQAEIKRRSLEQLSSYALPRAIKVMERLLGADSEYVQADVAKHISAIYGVAPQQDKTRVTTNAVTLNITIGKQPVTIDGNQDTLPSDTPLIDVNPT